MNLTTSNQNQTINDDQELAKALAGVEPAAGMKFEEAPAPGSGSPAPTPTPTTPPSGTMFSAAASSTTPVDPALVAVKQSALTDLRPLVNKLTISPEEKFDTYLLILRSTDDKSLIAPAYEAAKAIPDETRRAQALLDVIKEIDFLSQS